MPNGENMRVKKAKKNVVYGIITYVFLMILTFVSRKVFINVLGQDMAGLQGVLLNILSFLNLVESGVGMAIMFSLYKPFAEDDRGQIKSILTLYSRIYKFCGIVLLILGIILSNYLGIFVKGQLDLDYVKICFLLYIIDTTITYFFSYKTCVLYASQNGYIISLWDFNFKAIRYVVQILVLFVYKSFFVFILIQLVTNIFYLITINYIINKKFPWISKVKATSIEGKDNIIRNIKALFIHKIGSFVVFSTDNLLISYFLDLKTAGLFVNYNMILSFCSNFTNKIFDGINASIGNLLAEKNSEKAYEVFKKIFFFNFWLSSFICIALYNTVDSFVALWLGEEFILDNTVVIVLLLNLYITTMRMSVDRFKESGGLYYADRYAPFFEVIINLIFSIILVKKIGLAGVFIGTLISNLSVIFWVKPKIVFNQVFNKSFLQYLSDYLKYLFFGIIAFLVTRTVYYFISFNNGISGFLLNCILNVILVNGTYLIIFHKSEEFLYYKNMILKKLGRG
jgi:O-antigen/teichoic acid export membrane protein